MDMGTAILYSRVSTDEQADSGLGLDDQTRKVNALAELHADGLERLVLTDDGYSAKSLNRPGMTQALAMLESGEATMLIVSKLDRLTRSIRDFAEISTLADAQGWALIIGDPSVDTSKASGRLVLNLMMAVGEWEREVIGERTKSALAELKASGVRLGRPVLMDETVRTRIASERADGRSLRAIAAGLTADEIPTARGGKWYASTIKAVLASIEADSSLVAA